MSGHNKWSKIKHKKAITDAQKSKIFSKYAKFISVESKNVKGNITSPTLKAIIEKAKKNNMPAVNIERAVKKGVGDDGVSIEPVTYEVYGPGGCALIIEGLTDNKNRTAAEIKHLLSKHGLQLAEPGAAIWAFEKNGVDWEAKTIIRISEKDGEKLKTIIEAIENNDDVQYVYTNVQ